jgi:hemolysin III
MDLYPLIQELSNALTHGVGVVIFMVLSPLLISFSVQTRSNEKIIGASLFSFGLLAVYLSSTIFHAIPYEFTKAVLRYFDLLSIYLLIAGSYSAYILIYFYNKKGAVLLFIIWAISIAGITIVVALPDISFVYSLILYLVLGWIGIVLIKPSLRKVPARILGLLLLGGIFYTAGTYFFYYDFVKYYHAIWHVFVILGSVSHWTAIMMAVNEPVEKKRMIN